MFKEKIEEEEKVKIDANSLNRLFNVKKNCCTELCHSTHSLKFV